MSSNLDENMDDVDHDAITDYLRSEPLRARSLRELASGRIEYSPEAFMLVDASAQDKRYA
jgi:hypothetical protein